MTTRTMAGLALALLALAGTCRGATPDNTQPPSKPSAGDQSSTSPAQGIRPAPTPAWEAAATRFGGSKADTKPCRDVVMQFTQPNEVRQVLCTGGQRVHKGDKLIQARDADIVAAMNSQKDLAQNELEIQGAEKQLQLAEFKFNQMKASGQYSPTEFEEARIGAEIARVQRDQAKKNKIQQELKLKQYEGQYERYYLEAPFDGIIEEVMVEEGQGCNEQEKVLRMVNTDKLWLDPYAPTDETINLKLKMGSPAWVLVDLPGEPRLVQGKVLYVSPVADSVSQTRRVRVEIDNPEAWPAGTQAQVRFTEPSGEWEKYKAGGPSASERTGAAPDVIGRVRDGQIEYPVVLSSFSAPAWAVPMRAPEDNIVWIHLPDLVQPRFQLPQMPHSREWAGGCLVINSMPQGAEGEMAK